MDEGLIRPASPQNIVYQAAHRIIETLPAPLRQLWPSPVKSWIRQMLRRRAFNDLTLLEMQFEELRFEMLGPSDARYRWQDYEKNGCHEPITTELLLLFLEAVQDPIVWDVGSYCGYFAKVALEATKCEKVHVIEPNTEHLKAIKANLNDLTEAVIHPEVLAADPSRGMTGDNLASEHETPDIIKIDVDGEEGVILKGMAETLATRPFLLIELHYLDSYKSIRQMIIDTLDHLSYNYYLCENQRDQEAGWRRLASLSDLPANPPEHLNDSMLAAIPTGVNIKPSKNTR